MLSPRLLVFHLVNLWALSYLTLANDDDGWITVDLNDKSINWVPPVRANRIPSEVTKTISPSNGWQSWSWDGYTYYNVAYANSGAQVTFTFNGSAVRVFGAGGPGDVQGFASVDNAKNSTQFSFPSVNLTALAAQLQKPAFWVGNLTSDSTHKLNIQLVNSSIHIPTWAGIVKFQYMPSPPPLPQKNPPSPPDSISRHSSDPSTVATSGETDITMIATSRSSRSMSPSAAEATVSNGVSNSPNAPVITSAIINNGTEYITVFTSSGTTELSLESGRHGFRSWQIALLAIGLVALCALCILAFWCLRRTRIRAHALVLDTNPPVEVKSTSGTVTLDNREVTPTGPDYAFTRPGSSVSTSRDLQWRNSRIGVSPYLYQHPVPYPESTTDQSSHIDPVPIPMRRSMLATQPLPGAAVVRQITFSTKGRVLKVQNPDFRSNASTTETETPH